LEIQLQQLIEITQSERKGEREQLSAELDTKTALISQLSQQLDIVTSNLEATQQQQQMGQAHYQKLDEAQRTYQAKLRKMEDQCNEIGRQSAQELQGEQRKSAVLAQRLQDTTLKLESEQQTTLFLQDKLTQLAKQIQIASQEEKQLDEILEPSQQQHLLLNNSEDIELKQSLLDRLKEKEVLLKEAKNRLDNQQAKLELIKQKEQNEEQLIKEVLNKETLELLEQLKLENSRLTLELQTLRKINHDEKQHQQKQQPIFSKSTLMDLALPTHVNSDIYFGNNAVLGNEEIGSHNKEEDSPSRSGGQDNWGVNVWTWVTSLPLLGALFTRSTTEKHTHVV